MSESKRNIKPLAPVSVALSGLQKKVLASIGGGVGLTLASLLVGLKGDLLICNAPVGAISVLNRGFPLAYVPSVPFSCASDNITGGYVGFSVQNIPALVVDLFVWTGVVGLAVWMVTKIRKRT